MRKILVSPGCKCLWLFVGVWTLASFAIHARTAAQGNASLKLSPKAAPRSNVVHIVPTRSEITWDRRTYGLERGIKALMSVVQDKMESVERRVLALQKLGSFSIQLDGSAAIHELIAYYPSLGEPDLKVAALRCLAATDDPGVLPLFYKVHIGDSSDRVRLIAAGALARWNVGSGVTELERLMLSDSEFSPGRLVADEALKLIQSLGSRNGWGFPVSEVARAIQGMNGVVRGEVRSAWHDRFATWFEQNKHRFPDWKLGDPLPEVPADEEQAPVDSKQ